MSRNYLSSLIKAVKVLDSSPSAPMRHLIGREIKGTERPQKWLLRAFLEDYGGISPASAPWVFMLLNQPMF